MRKLTLDLVRAMIATIQFRTISLSSKNIKIRILKIIILPVVLYGCKTWSLILREESGLRVADNVVLRRMFGLKKDGGIGVGRKLHNKEIHNLHFSPSAIR
jgi:hypothetical protein